jgi:hypothetical protein
VTESLRLDPGAYPLLLPHFGYHGDAVYFGPTRVASVSVGEGWFLSRCDGTRTLAQAAAGCGVSPDFVAGAARWMVWWPRPIAPVPSVEPCGRVERLVLSPHPEDAWIGMGGRILSEAADVATLVHHTFQVFTGRHGASYRTTRELAMACTDEAAAASRLGGVASGAFRVPEHEARRLHHFPEEAAHQLLRLKLTELIAALDPNEIFVPAAVKGGPDSLLLCEVLLGLFADGTLEAELHLYDDAPDPLGQRLIDDFLLRFEGAFLAPLSYYYDFSRVRAQKESLLDVFACRLDDRRRRAARDGAKCNAGEGKLEGAAGAERFWEIGFSSVE